MIIDIEQCHIIIKKHMQHKLQKLSKMQQSLSLRLLILIRSEEHTSELQSRSDLVCRLLLEKKKNSNVAAARTYWRLKATTAAAFHRTAAWPRLSCQQTAQSRPLHLWRTTARRVYRSTAAG